jgi:hypothetical protein
MSFGDRLQRYLELIADIETTDESIPEANPDRWLTLSRELFEGDVIDTRIATAVDQVAALEKLGDDVRYGLDPDPETPLVDLDTGEVFMIEITVTIRVLPNVGQ